MRDDILYLVTLLILMALHYIIPFTLLREVRGFELFTFWTALVVIFAIITGIYVERR